MSVEGTSGNPSLGWTEQSASGMPDVEEAATCHEGASSHDALGLQGSGFSQPDGQQEELPFAEEPVALVDAGGMAALGEAAEARGYLWIALPKPGPAHRGRLGLFIEQTVEQELEERGALPPGIVSSSGLDASLSDQLYRARLIEKRGLALGLPSLEGITNLGRTLDADDSSVLRWWMAATSDRPVRLLIDQNNTKLRVYPSPVFFDSLFDVAPAAVSPRPACVEMADSSESMGLSDLPPAVGEHETNLLGTEVESVDNSTDDELSMPELDRALGLLPDADSQDDPSFASMELSTQRQLSLDYAESSPRTPTLIATVAPPAEQGSGSSGELSLPVESKADAPQQEERDRFECEAELGHDELDADDFLQTLAEDSAKAPRADWTDDDAGSDEAWQDAATEVDEIPPTFETASAEAKHEGRDAALSENPAVDEHPAADEPSPLPTKALRNPFIRMAEPQDTAEPSSLAADLPAEGSEESSIPQPSAAAPQDLPAPLRSAEAAPAADPNDPFNQLAAREWKKWVHNLEAARGPKPLSVIERMFVTDYTRLREAVRRGVADESALGILDEWRDSFESSYSEAFDALRVRGKRPTMVLDLPELAARLGRLQGAKRVQLLMVDGLRFDLGLMVQERMRQTADASLTERLLLWSALPTVTSVQIELLGKGPDGLKGDLTPDETPALVARGRAALTPRRVRTGSLEMYKLDVVEDSLREAGRPVAERLEEIADRSAEALVAHLGKQPARTMVVIFGDHGFSLDPRAAGTTEEVLQGGATPEEVLVPAFAWLTGAVH